ncbi:MAG: 3-isopropylmalate dehydratase small subunit [Candidatus Baldrarchaeia archaeon]
MRIKGRAWKFGDDINTDLIIAGKYKYDTLDMKELAKHAFEAIRPGFSDAVKPGDIIVAGKNFGSGSSREQAPLVIKALGIGAVVAKSFARIFYRNAINIGLPVITCEKAYDAVTEGDELEIDVEKGIIKNLTSGQTLGFRPLPEFMIRILKEGGIVNYLKKYGGFEIAAER